MRHLFALLFLGAAAPLLSAQAAGERVLFQSADGVELVGTFHGGATKRPCVLLLHGIGAGRSAAIWRPLAERLKAEGYAVLAFDFRGHGQSTTVEPDLFWAQAANRSGVRGAREDQIDVDRFSERYLPALVNDIAAAKALLDRKNDVGECNSANLVVIGADAGATLGAVWLNAEGYRYRQQPNPIFGAPPLVETSPEVQHVLAAIWLNIEPKLGSRQLSLTSILETPARRHRVPMVFLYDAGQQRTSQALERALKHPRLAYTGAMEIAAGGAERGAKLLSQPAAQEQLLQYLKNLSEDEADEWRDFDSRQAQFLWKAPRLPRLLPANRLGSNLPFFQTYESFLTH
jgi:alpha-beta hydrolase superfamily lysophospholipase